MNWLNNLDQVVDQFLPDDNQSQSQSPKSQAESPKSQAESQKSQAESHHQLDEDLSHTAASAYDDFDFDVSTQSSDHYQEDRLFVIDPLLEIPPFLDNNNNNNNKYNSTDTTKTVVPPPHDRFRGSIARLADSISSRIPQLPSTRPQRILLYNKSPQKSPSREFENVAHTIITDYPNISTSEWESKSAIDLETRLWTQLETETQRTSPAFEEDIPLELDDILSPVVNHHSSFEQSTGDVTTEQPQQEGEMEQLPACRVTKQSSASHQNSDSLPVEIWNMSPEQQCENDFADSSYLPPLHIQTSLELDDLSDFKVPIPIQDWSPPQLQPLDYSFNRLGVVQVRILAAQRLPCPVGSSVQAIVALPPWKGRVRSERTTTFGAPLEHGVSARWDQLSEASGCAMVHAWNSSETPVPSITLDLMFIPIKLLEFSMASLTLSCEPLMREPGQWKKQWCQAKTTAALNDSEKINDEHIPLILLEAAFIPAENNETSSPDNYVDMTPNKSSVPSYKFNLERQHSNDDISLDESHYSRRTRETIGSLSYMLTSKTKPHLLQVKSFWVPANCSVCFRSIIGWKRGYRCEVCNVDCCIDCQLQIDLKIPCGSDQSKTAVEKSIQSQMTVGRMLATIAPVDESYRSKTDRKQPNPNRGITKGEIMSRFHDDADERFPEKGIGVIKVNIRCARLFAISLPPDSDPLQVFEQGQEHELQRADLYVRITPRGKNGKSSRTKLVQNSGAPIFDSDEFILNVPDYAMEYRIELVDASSEKSVGSTLLTAQSLLQLQRDELIAEKGVAAFIRGLRNPERYAKQRHLALELRTGVKTGFGSDYFIPAQSKTLKDGVKAGEITGWLSIDVCLEENTDALFGPSPIQCPPRPPDELNTDLFQVHFGRIVNIFRDVRKGVNGYLYIVSWKDPALTAFSFVLFITLTLRFNTEYVGSLPVFLLICFMLHLAYVRTTGHLKDRFIEREKETRIHTEREATVNYSLHRPLGHIDVSLRRGKNLHTKDIGLPGSVGCHVIWDPTRYIKSEGARLQILSIDKALKSPHAIGDTNYMYSSNPVWTHMVPSEETKKLHQLLPSEGSFFSIDPEYTLSNDQQTDSLPMSIRFLVPQPMKATEIYEDFIKNDSCRKEDGFKHLQYELQPWSTSPGAIVVQVRMSDMITKLRLGDILGEVSIPISKIAESGEIQGWFQVLDPGSTHVVPVGGQENGDVECNDAPLVFLQFKWNCPTPSAFVTDTNREASIVVTEELIRAAAKATRTKLDLVGSSIGAFNTVRGMTSNIATIQNTLGSILDIIEGGRNAFNFTVGYVNMLSSFVVLKHLTFPP